MWFIICLILLVIGIWGTFTEDDGNILGGAALVAVLIMAISTIFISADHTSYGPEQKVIDVVNKVNDSDYLITLDRGGYTETITKSAGYILLEDKEDNTFIDTRIHNTDAWHFPWDTSMQGQTIVRYPLDKIKNVQ